MVLESCALGRSSLAHADRKGLARQFVPKGSTLAVHSETTRRRLQAVADAGPHHPC
jgi:hypothetical protein